MENGDAKKRILFYKKFSLSIILIGDTKFFLIKYLCHYKKKVLKTRPEGRKTQPKPHLALGRVFLGRVL